MTARLRVGSVTGRAVRFGVHRDVVEMRDVMEQVVFNRVRDRVSLSDREGR